MYYLITKDYSQPANVVHAFSTTTLAYSCYMSNTNCYYYYYYYYYYYLTIPVIPR
jgi:N-formylglutamate amidohydrolase